MAKKKITKTTKKSAASTRAKPAKVNAVKATNAKAVKKKKVAQPAAGLRAPKPDDPAKAPGKENVKQRGPWPQPQAASVHFEVVKSAMTALRRRLRTHSTAASRKSAGAAGHGADLDAALVRLLEDYKRVLGTRDT